MTASLTVLSGHHQSVDVTLALIEPSRLKFACPIPIPLGTLIKVVQDRNLWLGVVTECQADGMVSIRIEHWLRDIEGLSLLADRFVGKRREEALKSTAVS